MARAVRTLPALSRRTLLRGAGASVALPWLEIMEPRSRLAGALDGARRREPPRLSVLFVPNGVLPSAWTPEATGRDYELTPTLEPLETLRDRVFVLTGMRNANSREGEGHYVKTTALLSGAKVKRTGGRDLQCGTTFDQLVAQRFAGETPLPSLELGTEPVSPIVDMGYSTLYGGTISWRSPTRPAFKEIRPALAFDRLFRAQALATPRVRSVLDVVRAEAKALEGRLGGEDRDRVAEYFESVRAFERRIEGLRTGADHAEVDAAARPVDGIPADFATHVELMLDLQVLALRTNTTRVCTFMFGNAVSGRDFSFVEGVQGGHHPLSHHENDPAKQAQYQRINRWHVAQLARYLQALRSTPEADSNLLERSLVLYASGIRDGNRHDPNNLPVLLAGGGCGQLGSGGHLRLPMHTPLCNLYLTMLRMMGLEDLESFGDSTGALDLPR